MEDDQLQEILKVIYANIFLLHFESSNSKVDSELFRKGVLELGDDLEYLVELFNDPYNEDYMKRSQDDLVDILISYERLKDTLQI